jgi:site-specific recombinase XerD
MNGNKQRSLTLSQALQGYELHARARRLSEHTLDDYFRTFQKLLDHLGDIPITDIGPDDIEEFLSLQRVSGKTLLNIHTGLSALWTWAERAGLVERHVLHMVERPIPEQRAIIPYTEADVRAMLNALKSSLSYTRPGKRASAHSLPNQERNRAIILLLLDTGMRASELCGLRMHQVDLKNRRIKVFGKGAKERNLPISPPTGQALWKYLSTRTDLDSGSYFFVTSKDTPLDRFRLLKQLHTIGERAGVPEVDVHRFRHTFAINYLRNGGDPYSLQMLLGHTTLEMVRRYLAIAQADVESAHKRASPVYNWGL